MRVISKKKLRDFYLQHPQAEPPLTEWYDKMNQVNAQTLTELRKYFRAPDSVNGYTVFNIGGNKYRLVSAIHYNTQLCYVRVIWTHAEYSKDSNQKKLERDKL